MICNTFLFLISPYLCAFYRWPAVCISFQSSHSHPAFSYYCFSHIRKFNICFTFIHPVVVVFHFCVANFYSIPMPQCYRLLNVHAWLHFWHNIHPSGASSFPQNLRLRVAPTQYPISTQLLTIPSRSCPTFHNRAINTYTDRT